MALGKLPVLILVFLIFTGCQPLTVPAQEAMGQPLLEVDASQSIGQTFRTEYDGLEAVELYIVPNSPDGGEINLIISKSPSEPSPLAQGEIAFSEIKQEGYYTFSVKTADGASLPAGDYYLKITTNGNARLLIPDGAGETYLYGSAYQNDKPLRDSQLLFRLTFGQKYAILGVLKEAALWLKLLLIALLFFVLPGWGMLANLYRNWEQEYWPTKLGLCFGVSLSIYVIFIFLTNLIGLYLGRWYPWIMLSIGVGLLIYKNRKNIKLQLPRSRLNINLADVAYIILGLLVFTVRFYQARLLPVPMWWDGYHHTVITQLILDQKGIPNSWEPYAELSSLTYHFGFHSTAAVFSWVTGLNASQTVLWFGQILNGFAVLALYPLAARIGKNRWGGVVAVLLAGLLIPIPSFYLNWATYTMLAALTILPALLWFCWKALDSNSFPPGLIILGIITLGGLSLTHYRVLIYAVIFFIVLFLISLGNKKIGQNLIRLGLIGAGGAVIFLPWYLQIYSGTIVVNLATKITTPPADTTSWWTEVYNGIGPLNSYMPIIFWVLLALSMIWALVKREKLAGYLSLGCIMIFLAANPNWFHLPGTGILKNFSVLIGVYLPAAILIGAAAAWLADALSVTAVPWRQYALATLIIGFGVWGFASLKDQDQPNNFAVVTWPDMTAANWIKGNTPPDAKFLVNSVFTYGGGTLAGTDGGIWLPLTAGRSTTQPPIPYTQETSPRPDYYHYINDLASMILIDGVDSTAVRSELEGRGIEYVYIGQKQGLAGNWERISFLDVDALLNSKNFELIYSRDRVLIFRLIHP